MAAAAEVYARASGLRIERQEPRVERAGEYPPAAQAGLPGVGALPDTHPTGARFGVMARAIDVRVDAPALVPGLGVEGDHDVGAGLDVEESEGEHRGCLECQLAGASESRAELSGAIGPDDLEPRDVAAVDLIEAREALAEGVAAVVAPVAGVRRLGERARGSEARQCRHQPHQQAAQRFRRARGPARAGPPAAAGMGAPHVRHYP